MSNTQDTLRSLTLDIIENYRKAAKSSVQALRAGSSLSLGKVDTSIDTLMSQYDTTVGKAVKNGLSATQKQFESATEFADTAVDKVGSSVKSALVTTQEKIELASETAEKNMDKLVTGASKRLSKFPAKSGTLANLLQNKAVKKMDEFGFGIPAAKVFQYVSSVIADGAEELAAKVTSEPKKVTAARKTVRKVVAKTRARVKAAA